MSVPGGAGLGGAGAGGAADPNIKMVQNAMESCFVKTAMSGVAGFGLGGIFGMFMASMAYDTPFHTMAPTPTAAGAGAGAAGAGAAGAGAAGAGAAGAGAARAAATAAGTTAGTTTTAAAAARPAASAAMAAGAAAAAKTLPSAGGATIAAAAATVPISAVSAATSSAGAATGAAAAATAALSPPSIPLRQQLASGFRDMGSRSYSTAKNFGTVGAIFSGIECGIEGLRAKNDMGNGVAAGCLTGAILARNAGPQAAAVGCAGFAAFSAAIDAYLRMPPSDD